MKRLLMLFGKFMPLLRRYAKLDREEAELRPKVEDGIKKVMANGDSSRRKNITDSLKQKLAECKQ